LIKAGYGVGCFVGNALLAMYFKCGNMEEAHSAFEEMEERDIVSWNTMIAGYARHGFGKEALEVFDTMRKTSTKPDDITLVSTSFLDDNFMFIYRSLLAINHVLYLYLATDFPFLDNIHWRS
jgi:pentatricopeptide repeat protein